MSRGRGFRPSGGPKLPLALQQKLGLPDEPKASGRRKFKSHVVDRKEQRKAARHTTREDGPNKRNQIRQRSNNVYEGEEEAGVEDGKKGEETRSKSHEIGNARKSRTISQASGRLKTTQPKSILKRPTQMVSKIGVLGDDGSDSTSRESSPGLVLDANSRGFQDRMAEDDADIAALEKQLGMRGTKRKKVFDDGFDDILNGLDEGLDEDEAAKRDEQKWLKAKRRKLMAEEDRGSSQSEDDDDDELNDLEDDEQGFDDFAEDDSEGEGVSDLSDDDFGGFDEEEKTAPALKKAPKVRENPYVAPIVPNSNSSIKSSLPAGKYVPPSLRKLQEEDSQSLESLKRQVKGHLNRLSEANIISIVGDIEKLYQTNPRQDMTTVLIDLILSTFCNRSALQNTYIILHAAFLSAVYKIIGTDFGAELISRLVEDFDRHYLPLQSQPTTETDLGVAERGGKEDLNLLSLMANLFTFSVVSSSIIYDHIRLLLSDFDESRAELLLRIIRDCGPQLRSDDPSALKDIVQMMWNVSAEMTKKGLQLNFRTRFLMETITDLKNNKVKQNTANAGITGEHLTRMRKALKGLENRQLRATEPLRLTREDLANSDRKGKWWLVGASWKGNGNSNNTARPTDLSAPDDPKVSDNKHNQGHAYEGLRLDTETQSPAAPEHESAATEVDYAALAREYRMNTDVRRAIFIAVMAAEDCRHAQMRIDKLRLRRKQEQEIPRVILQCCRAEPGYNKYYSLLARNLLKQDTKRFKMSFLIALWKFYEKIGEGGAEGGKDDSDGEDDAGMTNSNEHVEMYEVVNLAKLYAYLVVQGLLQLGDVVKTLNLGFTKERATLFVEVLLISVILEPKKTARKVTTGGTPEKSQVQTNEEEEQLVHIFGRTEPRLVKSLQYVAQKVRKTDLLTDKEEKRKVKSGCEIAEAALMAVEG